MRIEPYRLWHHKNGCSWLLQGQASTRSAVFEAGLTLNEANGFENSRVEHIASTRFASEKKVFQSKSVFQPVWSFFGQIKEKFIDAIWAFKQLINRVLVWAKQPPYFKPRILPLLKLSDFKIPKGLETPEKRRIKTKAIADEIFPELLALIKKNPKEIPQAEAEQIFNRAFQKHIHPQGFVGFRIQNPTKRFYLFTLEGWHKTRFESKRLGDCFFTNEVDWSDPVYDKKEKIYSSDDLMRPVYYLGEIHIYLPNKLQTPGEFAATYGVLVHEINHKLRIISQSPMTDIELESKFENTIKREHYKKNYSLGSKLYNDYRESHNLPPLPKESERFALSSYSEWLHLKAFLNTPYEELKTYKSFQEYQHSYIDSLPLEDLRVVLSARLYSECEAYRMQWAEATKPIPLLKNKPQISWNIIHALWTTKGFQMAVQAAEERLKIPEQKRSTYHQDPWPDFPPERFE